MNAIAACQAVLASLPKAISGQHGSNATFRAACECVRFGLSDADAKRLLKDWNQSHCKPPWTEKELTRKLAGARLAVNGQLCTLTQPAPAVRVVWKIERKIKPAVAEPVAPVAPVKPQLRPSAEPSDLFLSRAWIVKPGLPIPAQFVDVLRTWSVIRQHPAWKDHPQLKGNVKQTGGSRQAFAREARPQSQRPHSR